MRTKQMPVAPVVRVRNHGRQFTLVRCPHCRDTHWLPGPPDQIAHCLKRPGRVMYVPEQQKEVD